MKYEEGLNYCILSNQINLEFLKEFNEYVIIDDNKTYTEVLEIIENFLEKRIVFNESWYTYSKGQRKKILDLLALRKINYINITSNIEDTLLCDYIYVFDKDKIVMEGKKESVLKEEKILKRLGYSLPFVVDLSLQLNYYNILDKIYFNIESLVHDLWN